MSFHQHHQQQPPPRDLERHAHLAEESANHAAQSHTARLPVIPDLRFESSYLRSIQRYVHVKSASLHTENQKGWHDAEDESGKSGGEGLGKGGGGGGLSSTTTPTTSATTSLGGKKQELSLQSSSSSSSSFTLVPGVEIQWSGLMWVTLRDQVVSPLLQGALWALASYYLTPFSAQLGNRVGSYLKSSRTEGLGVGWLRNWVKKLQLSGSAGVSSSTRR